MNGIPLCVTCTHAERSMSSLGMPEQYKGDWKEIEVPPMPAEEPEVRGPSPIFIFYFILFLFTSCSPSPCTQYLNIIYYLSKNQLKKLEI
jgi:hypothetical protein